MNATVIAMAAFLGALGLSLMGWIASGESFNIRKFFGSAITAIVSGIGVAVTYDYTKSLTAVNVMLAFLAGVGADAGRKAIANMTLNAKPKE